MKTLILGMGNPILSDDGVGLHMARALEGRSQGADIRTTPLIGLHLLDLMAGYERVCVIDALQTGKNPPGTVERLERGERCLHLFSTHGFHFFEIMELGKDLGYEMPEEIWIYGIEIGDECPFGEELSPALMEKEEEILSQILRELASYPADAS